MPISKEKRDRFERQIRALQELETDDPGSPEWRRRVIEFLKRYRAEIGLEAFSTEEQEDEFGELEFFRRARSLGMDRIRRDRA